MAKKTNKKKVSLEQLKAAAKDFNSFMEFEEPEGIPFDDMDYDELVEEITETAEELESEDEITQATADTLDALGVDYEATISEEEEEEDDDEDTELPTEAEIKKMKKAELVELAEELEVDVDGLSVAKMKSALIEELADEEEEEEEEEEEVEEEEVEEEEVEATPLKGKEAKVVKDAIAAVKKSRKLDDIKAIAKENGVRIPPPFLKDLKKLKPYVTGKLEDILSGEVEVKKAAKKTSKKKSSGNTLNKFFEENVEKGFDMEDEDEIVEAAKKVFPDKSYRVIGNALYSFVKKLG